MAKYQWETESTSVLYQLLKTYMVATGTGTIK